jgi:Na+-driven multidrug efflux pump
MLILVAFALRPGVRRTYGTLQFWPRWNYLVTLARVGVPSGIQWFSDVLAWGVFCNGVLAVVGIDAMQANIFMLRYMIVSFMPAVGIGAAVTALVGRYIGKGQPDVAARRAHLGFVVSLIYVVICGIIFIAARRSLMMLFTSDPDVVRIGELYLIFAAIYEIFDAMYINYVAALRGAGDTLVPAIAMAVLCWTISVLGGWIVAKWMPAWNPGGPWVMGCIYGAVIGIFMIARFQSGRWRRIQLAPTPASNVPADSAKLEPSI